ncbi:hypothetical protein H072_270 [Dactylellina haptotyla CBS 200.50]|uniref:BTB domain-containing protein n=1 Tax=Dactylellina haptotyla (strain CBS 200.50) TaxID=1284197 RepID=S8C1X5_DACHA|nr:hypothetical protein H072_270 [Dactylellina haptotyla CBS 200.50]
MQYIWFTREPDLIIELDNPEYGVKYGFLVSRTTLRLTSSVFDRMLSPVNGFKPLPEAWLNGIRITVLKVYDDDVAALGWVLNIIHFQVDSVPAELGWRDLVSVAIICDKYELQRAVRLWADKWTGVYIPDTALHVGVYPEQMLKEGCEDWLFIRQAFPGLRRCEEFSQRISSMLVEEIIGDMEPASDGARDPKGLEDPKALKVKFDLIPEATFNNIKKIREERFDHFISTMTQLLLDIHLLKIEIGYGELDAVPKGCQGNSKGRVCYEITLASSIGLGSENSWELETLYCASCLRTETSLWRLQFRINTLESLQQYYTTAQPGSRLEKRPRNTDFQSLIGSVTSRFRNL